MHNNMHYIYFNYINNHIIIIVIDLITFVRQALQGFFLYEAHPYIFLKFYTHHSIDYIFFIFIIKINKQQNNYFYFSFIFLLLLQISVQDFFFLNKK